MFDTLEELVKEIEEKRVFDNLWNGLEEGNGLLEMQLILTILGDLITTIDETMKEESRDSVIDALCSILQQHKEKSNGQAN